MLSYMDTRHYLDTYLNVYVFFFIIFMYFVRLLILNDIFFG
jgi:hypothetical protein